MRDGLFYIVTLVPALGCVLCCIPMLFFKFDGKERQRILEELDLRRAADTADIETIEATDEE